MHSYLLVFDDSTISRQEMIAHVDRLGAVANWMAFLPSAIALISPLSAHDLSATLRERRSGMRFVLSRLDPKATDGLLPAEVWSFLNDPAAVSSASGRVPHSSLTRRSA